MDCVLEHRPHRLVRELTVPLIAGLHGGIKAREAERARVVFSIQPAQELCMNASRLLPFVDPEALALEFAYQRSIDPKFRASARARR